jgi:hypothetical protein
MNANVASQENSLSVTRHITVIIILCTIRSLLVHSGTSCMYNRNGPNHAIRQTSLQI